MYLHEENTNREVKELATDLWQWNSVLPLAGGLQQGQASWQVQIMVLYARNSQ